jgi:tetratricopeptide (TPR) repeat protein
METLKRTILFFVYLFIVVNVKSQNNAAVSAFEKSYTYETNKEYAKAINEIKLLKDDGYECNLRLGWLNYLNASYAESAANYTKAISLMPYSVEARMGIAYPLSALGNWNSIISQYNEILKIDPKNSTINYRLALIYYTNKDYLVAQKYIEISANMYPFDYDSTVLFAWIKLQLGKFNEAKVLFTKALMIKPNDTSALEGLKLIK